MAHLGKDNTQPSLKPPQTEGSFSSCARARHDKRISTKSCFVFLVRPGSSKGIHVDDGGFHKLGIPQYSSWFTDNPSING